MGFNYMFNFFLLVSSLATKLSQNILQKKIKTHDDNNCNEKTAIACVPEEKIKNVRSNFNINHSAPHMSSLYIFSCLVNLRVVLHN
jgi:hypothetical protein